MAGKNYSVPVNWFRTMLNLRHIEEANPRRPGQARLARGRSLRVSAEGTLQIFDNLVVIEVPIPISRIYQMGPANDDPGNHIDFGIAQGTAEFPVL